MSSLPTSTQNRNHWLIIFAFAAVYVIWGSTYLAIKFAIETIPPFLMAGFRFTVAGGLLWIFTYFFDGSQAAKPTPLQWKNTFIVGFLLLVCGNGGVVWSEQMLPSGITALIVSIEPVWVVLIIWASNIKKPPVWQVWLGLFLGLAGMIILLSKSPQNKSDISLWGFSILLLATFAWAAGSFYSSRAQMPASAIKSTAMQMLCGGLVLILVGLLTGEANALKLNEITNTSVLAFLYLIVFGSIIGYSSYSYLTKMASPSQVSTYAYVNPVIAVILGTWLGSEALTMQMMIATPVLVMAVILLIWQKKEKP